MNDLPLPHSRFVLGRESTLSANGRPRLVYAGGLDARAVSCSSGESCRVQIGHDVFAVAERSETARAACYFLLLARTCARYAVMSR